jgi:hypothetical protein
MHRHIAANLRLAEREAVAQVPSDDSDGLDKFDDLPHAVDRKSPSPSPL